MKRMSECDSIYVLYVNRDKYDSPLYRIWSYTLAGLSAPHRWKTSKLLSFLQYYKFQLCCSLGNHYVEIINAVPLFNSQRKQGISQLPFLSETWVLSNCKVTISPCCLLSAPMVPYFETFFTSSSLLKDSNVNEWTLDIRLWCSLRAKLRCFGKKKKKILKTH